MTLSEFKNSLTQINPPAVDSLLKALWYDGKGEWQEAHTIAQDVHTSEGSWVHAYLHRKDGDEGNAGYWYHRANRKIPSLTLEEEWERIVIDLLKA